MCLTELLGTRWVKSGGETYVVYKRLQGWGPCELLVHLKLGVGRGGGNGEDTPHSRLRENGRGAPT